MTRTSYPKLGMAIALAVYGVLLARDPAEPGFLDRVDLVAHEAGHLLFSWFGMFLMAVGGTLGQLFVPAAFTAYFALRRELFSAAVTLFWVGQNFLNISVYVKDAQAMALPLLSIGGGDAVHDWNYLLSLVGLLRYDRMVGNLVYGAGLLTMLAAVSAGFYLSYRGEDASE